MLINQRRFELTHLLAADNYWLYVQLQQLSLLQMETISGRSLKSKQCWIVTITFHHSV